MAFQCLTRMVKICDYELNQWVSLETPPGPSAALVSMRLQNHGMAKISFIGVELHVAEVDIAFCKGDIHHTRVLFSLVVAFT